MEDASDVKALLAMTMLGLGEILGGYIVGGIRDKLGNRAALVAEMILLVSAVATVMIYNNND